MSKRRNAEKRERQRRLSMELRGKGYAFGEKGVVEYMDMVYVMVRVGKMFCCGCCVCIKKFEVLVGGY